MVAVAIAEQWVGSRHISVTCSTVSTAEALLESGEVEGGGTALVLGRKEWIRDVSEVRIGCSGWEIRPGK